MPTMLTRNRVENFARWKAVFDEQTPAAEAAGLHLTGMWRDLEDPNNVFFMFRVEGLVRARAFISDPASAEVGRRAGVLDGDYHFLEDFAGG